MEKETNLDLLRQEEKKLILNGREIIVKDLTVRRSLVAQDLYVRASILLSKRIKILDFS